MHAIFGIGSQAVGTFARGYEREGASAWHLCLPKICLHVSGSHVSCLFFNKTCAKTPFLCFRFGQLGIFIRGILVNSLSSQGRTQEPQPLVYTPGTNSLIFAHKATSWTIFAHFCKQFVRELDHNFHTFALPPPLKKSWHEANHKITLLISRNPQIKNA